MTEERASGRWTSFFRRKDLDEEDFFSKFLGAIARIFEGASEEETFRQIRTELVRAFDCDDISLFAYDPEKKPGAAEGDWVLEVQAGFGEGNRVCQVDGLMTPELQPGEPVNYTDELGQKAALKAVALAFEHDTYYGCDMEQGKVVLLKNPRPEDDMGSGDLSVLAIPLHYKSQAGRITERIRVGVLTLFKTPIRREMADLEKSLRSLLAYAIVTPTCMLRDPVTGLFTEGYLREELGRQLGLFEMTKGKLRGGIVVGMVDTLKLYKQTIQAEGRIDPAEISQHVSEVLLGVASCLKKRSAHHALSQGEEYCSGYPGRIGSERFGVILPLLQDQELLMWAIRLSKEVIDFRFKAEELLATGDITVTLRIIPFARGSIDELWGLATRALDSVEEDQIRARRDPEALAEVVSTIRIFKRGRWMTSKEYAAERGY